MRLIESKTLASVSTSVEFTSIPQDGTDLVVLFSSRMSAGGDRDTFISFNGSTSNFSGRSLYGTGASVVSGTQSRFVCVTSGATTTANTFSSSLVYIANYTGATNKSFSADSVSENNATTAYQFITGQLWSDTSAITSLSISVPSDGFAIGTIASLYKITKGSDGIVTTSP